MTLQTINIGTSANDGTGDPIRTAFNKVNTNFAELNSRYMIVKVFGANSSTTFNINSTSYIGVLQFIVRVDLSEFPFTHYRILLSGQSNASGQTVTGALGIYGTTNHAHSGGDDLVVNNTFGVFNSGWISRTDGLTGIQEYSVNWKGSNSTVDLNAIWLQLEFKIV